ncbi:hypothetical protein SteCoe_6086 [Stentor coeruleus]|uniref:Protein kinase domain-containing protein n=1 Tax=Stentor coeruleus TaxID=5963 RepID=A0A1R2CQX8_9CILI|nr:hypothetical protein SteCoe_6086 [Stentor coeruleus]
MSIDLYQMVYCELKERLIKKENYLSDHQKVLLERPNSLEASQLVEFCLLPDPDIQRYAMGLMLFHLSNAPVLNLEEALFYHDIMVKFIGELPEYKASIIAKYNSYLLNIIANSNTGEFLMKCTKKITELENLQCNVEVPKTFLKSKFTSFAFSQANKIQSDFSSEDIKSTAIAIQSGQKSGIDLEIVGNIIFSIGCDHVQKKYDINRYNQPNKKSGVCKDIDDPEYQKALKENDISIDVEEVKDLFGDLKRIPYKGFNNHEFLETLENIIQTEIPEKTDLKINLPPPVEIIPLETQTKPKVKKILPEETLKVSDFNKVNVIWKARPSYSRANEQFKIQVVIGELPNKELVAKKTYSLYDNYNIENVENEIKILTILSNRAASENSFLKFYGAERESVNETETNVTLYMEAHSSSLIDKITEYKKKGEMISKEITESIFAKLVLAFAEMQSIGIYHRDIKPHNILVTNDWNVKIIDFSVSDKLKHDDCYTTMTGVSLIQGTHGYMAPEVEEHYTKQEKSGFFRPGRADVFSLGLTIFQMISLKDTHALNFKCPEQYDRIKSLIKNLNAEEWVKILLTEMLNPDYHQRISFKKCLSKFPNSEDAAYKTIRN